MHCLKILFVTGVILSDLTGIDANERSPISKTGSSPRYESCKDILDKRPGVKGKDGVYKIHVDGQEKSVFCDMTTDGGGWTVIQKRIDGSVDFDQNWKEYKNGFGDPRNNYWIGSDAIHILTTKKDQMLRVDLLSFDCDHAYAKYSTFRIGNEASKYRLTVSGYMNGGTAGDALEIYNDVMFSTKDQVNTRGNCRSDHKEAWWYFNCAQSNLNGMYPKSAVYHMKYIAWQNWKTYEALKGTLLMVKPKN